MGAMSDAEPVFCQRCGAVLEPGKGNFYVIRVEALADPSPPVISAEDLARDHGALMAELGGELAGMSEQEVMDTVHRRLSFYLCGGCYRGGIEKPTG